MPDLRIYGVARTRAFRALWIAKELGLDYEHVPIEIGPAGARKAEYLAINPNGRLPAIDDGGRGGRLVAVTAARVVKAGPPVTQVDHPPTSSTIIGRSSLVDLTSRTTPDGTVTWDVPAGN